MASFIEKLKTDKKFRTIVIGGAAAVVAVVVLLIVLLSGGNKLEGTWVLKEEGENGKFVAVYYEDTMTIKDGKVTINDNEPKEYKTDGDKLTFDGETVTYKVDGDTLTLTNSDNYWINAKVCGVKQ